MIYAISDLHGIRPDKLTALLEKAHFSDNDFLFVLGDVIDRGEHSVQLLEWMMMQPNVQLLLGNHEAMLLSCAFVFDEITEKSIEALDNTKLSLLSQWLQNGGDKTLSSLKILRDKSPEAVADIIDFISDAPLYETVSVGGRDFLLTHSGLENFSPDKRLSQYTAEELLWNRPQYEDKYFDDVITVFGHTPTMHINKESKGKCIKTPSWIDIDTGVMMGYSPCLLRLDDLTEFYL